MRCHRLPHLRPHVSHRVADGLHDLLLFLGLNAEGGGDEALQRLAGGPGLFAHEADARRVVLQAGVHVGGDHVVGGGQVHVGT